MASTVLSAMAAIMLPTAVVVTLTFVVLTLNRKVCPSSTLYTNLLTLGIIIAAKEPRENPLQLCSE